MNLDYPLMILPSLNMQLYSEMIGNLMTDARSTGKYYHCKCTGCKKTKSDYFIYVCGCNEACLQNYHGFSRYMYIFID